MPVYPTISRYTGYIKSNTLSIINDNIHVLGNGATKYKFLSDFIDLGYSIMSIGDLLIHLFVVIVLYNVIAEINKREIYNK